MLIDVPAFTLYSCVGTFAIEVTRDAGSRNGDSLCAVMTGLPKICSLWSSVCKMISRARGSRQKPCKMAQLESEINHAIGVQVLRGNYAVSRAQVR